MLVWLKDDVLVCCRWTGCQSCCCCSGLGAKHRVPRNRQQSDFIFVPLPTSASSNKQNTKVPPQGRAAAHLDCGPRPLAPVRVKYPHLVGGTGVAAKEKPLPPNLTHPSVACYSYCSVTTQSTIVRGNVRATRIESAGASSALVWGPALAQALPDAMPSRVARCAVTHRADKTQAGSGTRSTRSTLQRTPVHRPPARLQGGCLRALTPRAVKRLECLPSRHLPRDLGVGAEGEWTRSKARRRVDLGAQHLTLAVC